MGIRTPGLQAPAAPMQVPDEQLRRLRWRARRGLLENDLLITRFLDRQGDSLSPTEADALARLLELSEPELLALLLGDGVLAPALDVPPVRAMLQRLRTAAPVAPAPSTLSRPEGA